MTGRPATPPMDTTRTSSDPHAIADDIRETRAELDDTISAIGSKLDPSHLVDEAKDMFTSSARDVGASMLEQVKSSSVLDTIKENPLPAMAVGLSVAWFLSKVGETESDRYRYDRYRETGDPYYAPRPRYGRRYGDADPYAYRAFGDSRPTARADQDESMLDKAKDAASDAADTLKDTASNLGGQAAHLADQASDTLGGATGAAGDRARGAGRQLQRFEHRAESWLDRQLQENPLAVGAVALAAGALVGLSVPETDAEHRALGQQAETARQRLASAASDASERVTSAAQDVADEAAEKAKSVGQEAEREAKDIGSKAEDRLGSVTDSVNDDLQTATPGSNPSNDSPSTGASVDLSTTADRPDAGTTAPPRGSVGTPTTTVDLTGDPNRP